MGPRGSIMEYRVLAVQIPAGLFSTRKIVELKKEHRREISPLTIALLIGVLSLIWGSTWVVIKGGLQDLPPFTSAGLRLVVAALILIGLARPLHRWEGGDRPPVWITVMMGVLNFAVSYGLVYWCETLLPSSLTSVLWAVFPMMVALCSHLYLPGERLVLHQGLGFLVGFAGVALLFITDVTALGPEAMPAALLLLLSPGVCAVTNVVLKRHGADVSSVLMNRNSLVLGAVLLLALAGVTEREAPVRWTPMAVFSVAYLGTIGTVVPFSLYFWLLRHTPAHRLSLVAYVIPAVALTLGWTVGQEAVGLHTLGGTALILLGVYLVVRSERPATCSGQR